MLKLSDDELTAVMNAAQPIDPDRRGAFLESVASALVSHQGEVGVGFVHRVCAEQQRRFYSPPLGTEAGRRSKVGKYSRG